MELSSAFRERLELMESTRNQRLSLLQAEKECEANRSQVLSSKLTNIRSMEQRCLLLDRNIAFQNFKILALKSEIESLDAKYQADLRQLRVLKSEVEELEEEEKEREVFYELKSNEIKAFKETVEKFVLKSQMQVNELKDQVNELNSAFVKLQGNNGYLCNSEIAPAEMRKSELVAVKENLDKHLASNYQLKSELQKQLQSLLSTQDQGKRKQLSQFTVSKGSMKSAF
ncbi:uncharacterized protein LOC110604369 [Manihot esculenta]|uniref:Uncharacterized protein n=1 Tax=Manihot esculenta TaxID=3983 RepID=A0A2C9U5V0_MANES|nr:uncharacterized protein LOC110604369 [Manihot esculenta]OAY25142.1 hypothetical protein MANES_17G070400v8 [Manihot esculenta]